MPGSAFRRVAAAVALLAAAPAMPLAAAPSTGETIVLRPLTLVKVRDLDFGALIATPVAGTAILNPLDGTVSTTGGVTSVSSATSAASFAGARSLRGPVQIKIPTAPIAITRVGGTQTMTVNNWTLDGHKTFVVGPNEAFEFNVGATLFVGANQVPGTYVGSFNVTVNYP